MTCISSRRTTTLILIACACVLILAFVIKVRCVGPTFDTLGRSAPSSGPSFEFRAERDVCYSDIQYLWLGRGIDQHVFPYMHGGIGPDGKLFGGAIEYPVLTGVVAWLSGYFAHNDGQLLIWSSILLTPFALAIAWILSRLSPVRAWIWVVSPTLALYAFHNWSDLPAVACTAAAIWVVAAGDVGSVRLSPHTASLIAAALLAVGCAFKIYPALFIVPLAIHSGLRANDSRRWFAAFQVVGVGTAVIVALNLPFAMFGYAGWRASFTFQQNRSLDSSTNSAWYWGARLLGVDMTMVKALASWLSPLLVMLAAAAALIFGWTGYRRTGTYPWLAVSAAMLAGFLTLYRVNSPQYALWLIPFFVVLATPLWLTAVYLLANSTIFVAYLRWSAEVELGSVSKIGQPAALYLLLSAMMLEYLSLCVLWLVFVRFAQDTGGAAGWKEHRACTRSVIRPGARVDPSG